ncbi:MAG TPA: hypothetical protein VMW75_06055 [Thermoanaerobaculia bacterium]|nr:hypothetical protein [Thermoanaerobaculia bacterium]
MRPFHPLMLPPRVSAPLRRAAAALLLVLCAGPLAAYTIWLKDGTSIIARGKYEVKNGKAIITLQNGEQSFLDASQIDAARTEAANRGKDYNTTELGNTRVVPGQDTPPPPDRSLSDLVQSHRPSTRQLPTAKRASEAAPGQQVRSKAGYLDLERLQHVPYARSEITADLQQFFRSQGLDEIEIWNGSQPDRVLIEVTTASEASVFQGLTAGANALLRERDRFPQAVAAFEMVLKTPARERAGQFVLTPETATALVAKKIEPPAFFVANVQF